MTRAAISPENLLERFRKGDTRALSRLISEAENEAPFMTSLLAQLYPETGKARVVGITGPPGAGKSTLADTYVKFLRERQEGVGVVAVDPVSPFSGGALLGDRIRLVDHFNDPKVFIRSLSTRGKLGGLSLATREVVHLVSAFGFDNVVVETVGVGQSEVEIRKLADVTLVVLVPEWGDAIQALKAGLLEIGDIFVVNKADREGAERIAQELKVMLQMAHKDRTPVLLSQHQDEKSRRDVFAAIDAFFTSERALIERRRQASVREAVRELLEALVVSEARAWVEKTSVDSNNPYRFMEDFSRKHPRGSFLPK